MLFTSILISVVLKFRSAEFCDWHINVVLWCSFCGVNVSRDRTVNRLPSGNGSATWSIPFVITFPNPSIQVNCFKCVYTHASQVHFVVVLGVVDVMCKEYDETPRQMKILLCSHSSITHIAGKCEQREKKIRNFHLICNTALQKASYVGCIYIDYRRHMIYAEKWEKQKSNTKW